MPTRKLPLRMKSVDSDAKDPAGSSERAVSGDPGPSPSGMSVPTTIPEVFQGVGIRDKSWLTASYAELEDTLRGWERISKLPEGHGLTRYQLILYLALVTNARSMGAYFPLPDWEVVVGVEEPENWEEVALNDQSSYR